MSELSRENDLVLSPNEYAYVLDNTKGLISCVVGSYKMSLSTSDSLVTFNERTKRFEKASYSDAIATFVSAPENWYIVLKNPAEGMKHPTVGSSNTLPTLQVGKKINIPGSVSFALYPGQMAKVIQGHRMHSNQYLLARVYDADALEKEIVEVPSDEKDADGEPMTVTTVEKNKYVVGQILVIKGNEVPFYIPPTGIEVLPKGGHGDEYVRDAVTLEKLEYCILKNEKGEKKYVHGAAVVFPEPDESFVENPETGGYKFRAIELSDISGVYVKVISDYEEKGKSYKVGEELFITGKEQMIYYPRPEHAIIDYEGQVVHHAIAIPVGEGRYVLDRQTGNITTIKGPKMFLPDPRNQVIVRRKLSESQCNLWYPGNKEVLRYNTGLSDPDDHETDVSQFMANASYDPDVALRGFTKANFFGQGDASVERSGISRGNHYTKPRTITINNKLDGVVTVDIWTGYAINVVSKNGDRKVILGPQTYLMDYDQTMEVLELSTGKPKTTDNLMKTVFLRVDNNKVADIINVQTRDFVDIQIKVSYCVNFLPEFKDKWFSVDNYVKYLTDHMRSLLKGVVRQFTIEEFYENSSDIVRNTVLDIWDDDDDIDVPSGTASTDVSIVNEKEEAPEGMLFDENGMFVHDVEVLSIKVVDGEVSDLIESHQFDMVQKAFKLSGSKRDLEISQEITKIEKEKADLENQLKIYKSKLDHDKAIDDFTKQQELARKKEDSEKKATEAKKALQTILDSINESELKRKQADADTDDKIRTQENNAYIALQNAQAESIEKIMTSITPDLVAAMTSSSNAELLKKVAGKMSPYAIARGESIADTVNLLVRGTSLEGIIDKAIESIDRTDLEMAVESSEDNVGF